MPIRARLASIRRSKAPGPPGETAPVSGLVEQFSRRLVIGWVAVPQGRPPVRIDLFLDDLRVSSTYATPAERLGRGTWKALAVEGVPDPRRLAKRQVRTFSFRLRDIWRFAGPRHRLTIRVDGRPVPIHGHGMYRVGRPHRAGERLPLEQLRQKLQDGYVFSQYGRLQLSKQVDHHWQQRVHELYDRVRELVERRTGHRVFVIYGTLLGAVRDNGYVGHDVDFDAAYLSGKTSGPEAADEMVEIALALIDEGLDVECKLTALHISDPDRPDTKIDLFHTYFDDEGRLSFPFGMAGTRRVRRDEWEGVRETRLPGGRVYSPVNAEAVLEQLYGSDWSRPKPGFNWTLDRTDAAREGHLNTVQRSKVYWANFYSRHEYTSGSTFFESVSAMDGLPSRVLDIGCGDGRDSCAFAEAGRTVIGLDSSPVGVSHAAEHAAARGLIERVRFEQCDVADRAALTAVVRQALAEAADEPVAFYLRFFLHAITEEAQATLMDVLAAGARSGDWFAAEFRTEADAAQRHVHEKHYRRFQSGLAFREALSGRYGFTVLHAEEGTGLSPYKGEDPVLCRVVARR
jgi:SAM-dependent methyltransferase